MFSKLLLELKAKAEANNRIEPREQEYRCKECGAPMIKRASKFKKGKFWYGCSNFPKCRYTAKDGEIKFKEWQENKSSKMF